MFFKKILSYLIDIQLDRASTPLNSKLELSLRQGRFYLTTENAVYSFGDLYDNFRQTFHRIDFSKNKIEKMLILGFGLGSVPYMLEQVFHQNIRCTGIEADGKIVEWANQHILPTLTSPTKLIHEDALIFIENNAEKFDLIVIDLFMDDLVPGQFETTDFLENIKVALSPNGLILFNRLADTPQALHDTQTFFDEKFKSIFPTASYLEIDGNWMLANRAAWA